ncbi:MAG: hypothetical protein M1822_002589 [Bathelium mastoideum]|nr:MAG: hypothetical protein M1822_002589 [Bathelium mastoideum]
METASAIIGNLFRVISYGSSAHRDELEEVHFSATLLLRALAISSERILGRHPAVFTMGQGRLPLLERRMKEAGWCPYMIARVSASFPNDTQAFTFALGTIRTKQKHSSCNYDFCVANQVGESYTVQHTDPACRCELIAPPLDQMLECLRKEKIPMLRLQQATDNRTPTLLVETQDLSGNFLAISHLWADGLGNPYTNAVPSCQLERIWNGIKEASLLLAPGKGCEPCFWFDTLCIPVGSQHQAYRDFSIQKMHDIYSNASGVLVLDSDLNLLAQNVDFAEVVTRTVLSGWNTRLWTYQEATLTSNLFICTKDSSLSLNHLVDGLVKAETWPDPLSHALNISAAASLQSFLPRRHAKVSKESDIEVQNMLMAIGKRITSRADDEAICIATTLGLDPSSLLEASSSERMPKLLQLLPSIPANVLFSTGSRLTQEGLRWAPESFLQPKGLVGTPIPESVPKSWAETTVKEARPMFALHPQNRGLRAFLPAIQLQNFQLPTTRFTIKCNDNRQYSAGFYVRDPSLIPRRPFSWNPSSWLQFSEDFVILLPMIFPHDRAFDIEQTGIFARVAGPVTQYLARVFVNENPAGGKVIRGRCIDPCWWLID